VRRINTPQPYCCLGLSG
jgi:hypothetical protein